MSMILWATYICVHHICAWYSQSPEEGIISLRIVLTDGCELTMWLTTISARPISLVGRPCWLIRGCRLSWQLFPKAQHLNSPSLPRETSCFLPALIWRMSLGLGGLTLSKSYL